MQPSATRTNYCMNSICLFTGTSSLFLLYSPRSWNKTSPVFGTRWWAWWRRGSRHCRGQRPAGAQRTPASPSPAPRSRCLPALRAARWRANSTASKSSHPSSSRAAPQLLHGLQKPLTVCPMDSCPQPLMRDLERGQARGGISTTTSLSLACSRNTRGVAVRTRQAQERFPDRCTLCQRKL